MKQITTLILLFILHLQLHAQSVTFQTSTDKLMVLKGTTVKIESDTAYVIGTRRALALNQQLDELKKIKSIYNELLADRNQLIKELKSIQHLLEKLKTQMTNDSAALSGNISQILLELENTMSDLKNNNTVLAENNTLLNEKVDTLKQIVKELRKETKWIWWNGLTDKIVVFAGGAGFGILLTLVLI